MATRHHNLSQFDAPLPSAADMRFGIVVAEWNREITEALLEGAVRTLRAAGCPDVNIQIKFVPGTFELTLGAQFFAEYTDVDAVVVLAENDNSPEYAAMLYGVTKLQISWNMPVLIGDCIVASEVADMVAMQNEMEAAAPEHISPDRKSIN